MALSFALTMADAHGPATNDERHRQFMSITFVDENHGWTAGDAGVLHTSDGGNTRCDDRFKQGCENITSCPTHIQPESLSRKEWLADVSLGLVAKNTDGGNTWCGIADLPN